MEYPKHYRVVVRMLAEPSPMEDESDDPSISDELREAIDEDNQRIKEKREQEQQELEDRLDRTRFGIKDEEDLKDSIKAGLTGFGDGTCDWKQVDNYSYKEIDELISERFNNFQLLDTKLIQDISNDIVNHPHLTKDQKQDLLYELNNLNHHIYASIDILRPDTTIYSEETMLGIDHLLKLDNRNPNYRVSSPDEYNKWIGEFSKKSVTGWLFASHPMNM